MAEVTLKKVCKHFGKVVAVDDFNLEIKDGEFVILVGTSGCGKTTTLRMIAGLEEVSSGEVFIDGNLVNYLPPSRRDIAMVFQNYALYPHMNVFKNISFGLRLRKLPKQMVAEKVRNAAGLLGIADLLDRKPRELSGGQRQRVALGRAIVRDPKVFLFDEPLSNLDAKLRVAMRAELLDLHQRLGTTTIYVTHDQMEAMTMGDRIVVMQNGRIQQVDSPQELYDHPINKYVAGFIGSPAMNFISCVPVERNGGVFLQGETFLLNTNSVQRNTAKKYLGREIILGIRPEHTDLKDKKTGFNTQAEIKAPVWVVEPLGSESLVHFKINGQTVVARLNSRTTLRPGETTNLVMDMDKAHLFDKETEETIF